MVLNKSKRVIALGFFDGVHRGHGALLKRVVEKSRELGAVASAFTFDRSPTAAITGQVVPLLEDRAWLMRTCYGIQEVIVSSFDGMMRMDWRDFITEYLVKELGVVHVVAGHDFHFGYMGKGNPQRLQETCAQLGIGCDIIGKVELEDITISSTYIRTLIAQGEMDRAVEFSTYIRTLIAQGEMDRAVEFLGHPHVLTNRVTHGKKIGSSSLGFPTVNLQIPSPVIVPAFGVYATQVSVAGQRYTAVTNVGVRPTVEDNDGRVTVEGFILDFSGDLYGQELRMEFYHRIREERKFSSFQALSDEIRRGGPPAPHPLTQRKGDSSMRHHADSMRYDRMYTLLWIYAAALALFGLFLGPLDQILPGLATIVLTEDALITDYVLIAGPGAALINSALVTAVTLVMLRLSHEPFNGFSLVVVGLMTASPLWWWGSCPASPCLAKILSTSGPSCWGPGSTPSSAGSPSESMSPLACSPPLWLRSSATSPWTTAGAPPCWAAWRGC